MPSAKYASAASPRLSNGITATACPPVSPTLRERQANNAPTPINSPIAKIAAMFVRRLAGVATLAVAVTDGDGIPAPTGLAPDTGVGTDPVATRSELAVTVIIAALSASPNASAVAYRSAGIFASPRCTTASSASETEGRATCSERGVSVSVRAVTVCTFGPVNGASPASISYSTHASAYTSVRASRARSPIACSGLM